jgi:replicative DNA helicase
VAAPALTLGLVVQPEVLRDIARLPGFRGRGLLARILYALPENTVGRRRIGTPPVPAGVATVYERRLRELVLNLAGTGDPLLLRLSPEANERVLHLERTLEPRLAPDAELGHLADWAEKLTGATARVAGLLHLAGSLHTGWAQSLPARVVDDAVRVGHYYLAHALAVFDTMAADPVVDDARAILDWIVRTERTGFTRREAFTAQSRARFRKVTDLDPALAVVDEHGYIRRGPIPEPTRGRPASPPWEVHPRAAEAAEAAEPAQAALR